MWAPSTVSETMTVITPRISDVTELTVLTPEDSVCPLSKSPKYACCYDEPCTMLCVLIPMATVALCVYHTSTHTSRHGDPKGTQGSAFIPLSHVRPPCCLILTPLPEF